MKRALRSDSFDAARVGSVAMGTCGICGQATGTILMKMKGPANAPEYDGPRLVRTPDSVCEFCHFLHVWMSHEKINPRETGKKYGAAKLVVNDAGRKLIAFVPFAEDEDRAKTLADGTPFVLAHRMIVGCDRDDNGFKLSAILDKGV